MTDEGLWRVEGLIKGLAPFERYRSDDRGIVVFI